VSVLYYLVMPKFLATEQALAKSLSSASKPVHVSIGKSVPTYRRFLRLNQIEPPTTGTGSTDARQSTISRYVLQSLTAVRIVLLDMSFHQALSSLMS